MYHPESTRHRASEGFSAISGVQNLLVIDSTFNLDQRNITPYQKQRSTDDLRRIADWLTPINFRVIQCDTFTKHTPGTGTWLIDHPQFQKWLSGNNQVLWVEGIPGSGKTVLASIVTNHLQTHFSDDHGIAMVFAYCQYTDRYPLSHFLASFIKQLAEEHPHVFSHIESVYTKHQKEATRPHETNLLELFQKLVGLFKKAYIIIDAVDEASDDTRDHFLRALLPLQANLLLTSRPSNLSKHLPQHALVVYIDNLNQQDVEHFINTKFRQLIRLLDLLEGREELGQVIRANLTKRSNGMFLLAALQLESLKGCTTVKKLRRAVESLPSDLNAIYLSTLKRIETQNSEDVYLAMRAITLLTYAYRSLKITELQHALSVSKDDIFDGDDVVPEQVIISVCCGLIVVDENSKVVRLVHYTTLDFFKDHPLDQISAPHSFIVTTCLTYLSTFEFPKRKLLSEEDLKNFLKKGPFLGYAYKYWGFHAKVCYKEGGLPNVVIDFLLQLDEYPFLLKGFDLLRRTHIAVYYGLLDRLPATNEWCNQRTTRLKYTPLILACGSGNEGIVKLLLSQDVDINIQVANGRTALILASEEGHVSIVELLVSRHDVALNTQGASGCTALILASLNGHEAVARLILARDGININTQARYGRTALMFASDNGHEAVVQLLLSHNNVALNVQDKGGNTALILACLGGHEAVARLLLTCDDITINTQNKFGMTALIRASFGGHEAMVQLLLSRNVALNIQDENGQTALICASADGHEGVVQLLLSHNNVALNVQDKDGHTALILSSLGGHEAVARLLLARDDITINTQNKFGQTALFCASKNGHEAVVQLLLSHNDVALNTQDKHGRTALFAASTFGHYAVVKLLLSHNLDIAIDGHARNGQTALVAASTSGHEAVVKLLRSHNVTRSSNRSLGLLNMSCTSITTPSTASTQFSQNVICTVQLKFTTSPGQSRVENG